MDYIKGIFTSISNLLSSALNKYPRIINKDILAVLIICISVIVIRVLFFIDYHKTAIFPFQEGSDAYYYYIWGFDIASGDIIGDRVFMKWPLYAYFLGFILKLFDANVQPVFVIHVLLSSLQCVFIYLIGRKIFNRIVGIIAAFLCVTYGFFSFYDGLLLYSTLSLFLNSGFLLFIIYSDNKLTAARLLIAGLFLGLCTLAQGNAALFGVAAVSWLIIRQESNARRRIAWTASFILGLAIIISPVTVRNYVVGNDFVPLTGSLGAGFFLGNNPTADGLYSFPDYFPLSQEAIFMEIKTMARAETDKRLTTSEVSWFWLSKSIDYMVQQPLDFILLQLSKLTYFFRVFEPVYDMEFNIIRDKIDIFNFLLFDLRFILPLGFIGMLINIRFFKEKAPLYLAVILFSLSNIAFYVTTRYRMTFVPFMSVFAGAGAYSFWDYLKNKKFVHFACWITLTIIFFDIVHIPVSDDLIKSRMKSPSLMMTRYANIGFNYMKRGDYASALSYADKAHNVNPLNYSGILLKGRIYLEKNNIKMAEKNFKDTIEKYPYCVSAYYYLGMLYNNTNKYNLALDILYRALFLYEDLSVIYIELGKTMKGLGRIDEARAAFQIALDKTDHYNVMTRNSIFKMLKEL
jgi:4-amino-4-deoxy-L-arabinose transferase-like glycosyltransferase